MSRVIDLGAPQAAVRIPTCYRASTLEDLYALLVAIRLFEESVLELFSTGVLAGTTHTSLGQEATAVGVLSALDHERDVVFSNHRGHAHFLAYCGEVERLYLELMGKPGGVCGGRGGSQHLHIRNFYSSGVLGGTVPIAVGVGVAERARGTGAIVTVFMGDGAFGEGVVYEAINMAALWSLPVLFVVEDNEYAQSTPRRLHLAGSIRARLEAFGIPVDERSTTDVRDVLRAAVEAGDLVRATCQPRCLVIQAYRLGPHSKGDDHRDAEEVRRAWTREPVATVRPALDASVARRIETETTTLLAHARERALQAPSHGR